MSGIKGCKSDSGAAKRKRKKLDASIVNSQAGALYKHFASCSVSAVGLALGSQTVSLEQAEVAEAETENLLAVSDSGMHGVGDNNDSATTTATPSMESVS